MSDYTSKHKPDPKWTPNLNALVEFMRAGEQARAAASELTKLKALAALAEEYANDLLQLQKEDPTLFDPEETPDTSSDGLMSIIGIESASVRDWLSRYDAITKDGGK